MGKGFSRKHLAEKFVMLNGAYTNIIEQLRKNPNALPTLQNINNAYQLISSLLHEQIEKGASLDIDLTILKEASTRIIFCEDCGSRLIPYLEITHYNKETGKPVYCIHQ